MASLRIIIAGSGSVGKTSFLRRLKGKKFTEHVDFTVGYEETSYSFLKHKIFILDVGGRTKFRKDRMGYYAEFNPDAVIFMFSLRGKRSIEVVDEFADEIFSVIDQIPFILVGSKADIRDEDVVTSKAISKLRKDLSDLQSKITIKELPYLEISAKTGLNIKEVFPALIKILE